MIRVRLSGFITCLDGLAFSPIGVPGCPVDIRNLGVERATFAKFSSGETWLEKDFWPGTRGYTALDRPWTGKTIFEVSGYVKLPQFWLRSFVPVMTWTYIHSLVWCLGSPRGGQRWGIWAIEEKALGACAVAWLARQPLTLYILYYIYNICECMCIYINIYIIYMWMYVYI